MSGAHLLPMWDKGVKPKWLQGKPLARGENPGLPYKLAGLEQNPLLQKSAFEGQCPSPVFVCFGDFRDF